MPDGAIVIPDTATAPKDYTLSGAQEIQLKSVRAVIDGTGAAGAFLPTLQLLDPNGHVMWEGATPTTVAAGASADVSWFPGLGQQTSGGGGTTSAVMPYASVTLPNWVWPQPGSTSVDWTGATVHTTDNTVIEDNLGSSATVPLKILKAGIYVFYGSIGPWLPAWGTQAELINLGSGVGGLGGDEFLPNAFPTSFTPLIGESFMAVNFTSAYTVDPPGGQGVSMEVNQNSGSNRSVSAFIAVYRLTGNGSGI